jgi:hypothetical protein
MRLWSVHPRHLDRQGLTACWREALLAQAVLAGRTRGYRAHPQLERFRSHADPSGSIHGYLHALADEADSRGYRYDRTRIDGPPTAVALIAVTSGQLDLEWSCLRGKLAARSPEVLERWDGLARPDAHPSFVEVEGPVATWERNADASAAAGGAVSAPVPRAPDAAGR